MIVSTWPMYMGKVAVQAQHATPVMQVCIVLSRLSQHHCILASHFLQASCKARVNSLHDDMHDPHPCA